LATNQVNLCSWRFSGELIRDPRTVRGSSLDSLALGLSFNSFVPALCLDLWTVRGPGADSPLPLRESAPEAFSLGRFWYSFLRTVRACTANSPPLCFSPSPEPVFLTSCFTSLNAGQSEPTRGQSVIYFPVDSRTIFRQSFFNKLNAGQSGIRP
jgi:hypothetical protein